MCFPRIDQQLQCQIGRWVPQIQEKWMWRSSLSTYLMLQRHNNIWKVWRRRTRAAIIVLCPESRYVTNAVYKQRYCHHASVTRVSATTIKLQGQELVAPNNQSPDNLS